MVEGHVVRQELLMNPAAMHPQPHYRRPYNHHRHPPNPEAILVFWLLLGSMMGSQMAL